MNKGFKRGLDRMCAIFESPDSVSIRCIGVGLKCNNENADIKVYRRPCVGDTIQTRTLRQYVESKKVEIYEYESEIVSRLDDAEKLNFHILGPLTFMDIAERMESTASFIDRSMLTRLNDALSDVGAFRCASLGVELKGGEVCKVNFYHFPVEIRSDGLYRGGCDPEQILAALTDADVSNLNEGLLKQLIAGSVRIVSCSFNQDGKTSIKVYADYNHMIAKELFGSFDEFEQDSKFCSIKPCMISFTATGVRPERSFMYFMRA